MEQNELMNRIAELEREIAVLPEGSITRKKIKDKEYYYHRVTRDGKRSEQYVSFEEVAKLRSEIEKRKTLEKELKELKAQIVLFEMDNTEEHLRLDFKTTVRTGKQLTAQIAITRKYKKGVEFKKAAFIQIKFRDTLSDVDADLRLLEENGYKYVFIDEVTLMEDFIEGAAIFSDIYASSGMKIVLSGADSLGFAFSKQEQLYDRCIMLHTTFIQYREFEEVLGIKGIDEYIRYGGTMSLGGINYNADAPFADHRTTEEYIDTAIAKNIQHSLKMYQYGGHFRQLLDLYEGGELTNVINRVVENINHSFTRKVVERTFKSHDISVTANNLLKDRENPINIKAHMNLDAVTLGIMQVLDILNKEEQSIDINDVHMTQVKEYLSLLDLVMEIDLEYLPDVNQNGKLTVITQPGMRYAQAGAIVENLLCDAKFQELSAEERKRILDRLLSEIRGRMMEDIVLLETKLARPDKKVFKIQFPVGEIDMVVADPKALTCEIYEVKYSKEQVAEQYRHITDDEKCAMTRHRYGDILGRYVIYRGENAKSTGVQYLNVEDYLKSLAE